ncbi:MAG: GAF domain-containing protein [Anaerolineales bacterium]|nr:GAF domain-containing protein [Anaerolineales bacterium]
MWDLLTAPSPLVRARDQQRQARLVATLFLGLVPISIFFTMMPLLVFQGGQGVLEGQGAHVVLLILVVAVIAYVISRTQYHRLSAVLLIAMSLLAVIAMVWLQDESDYVGLCYLVLPVLLASVLLSNPIALCVTLVELTLIYITQKFFFNYDLSLIMTGPFRFVLVTSTVILVIAWHRNAAEQDRQAELAESETRYRNVVEQASEGIALYAIENTRVVETNPAYQTMLGYSADEMLGLTLYDIVAHDRESIDDFVKRICHETHVVIGERKHRRKDGSLIDVDVTVSLFTAYARDFMCVVVRDITERKYAEGKIRTHSEQLEALRAINLELSAELDLSAVLQTITLRTMELSRADGGGFYRYVPEHDILERQISVGNSFLPLGQVWRRGEGLAGKILETRQPLMVDDYATWQGRSPILPATEHFALIGVPVMWRGEILGVLSANRFDTRSFTPDDLELLTMFATHAAVALRNAQIVEAEEHQRQRAESLSRATATLLETLDMEPLLGKILSAAIQAIPSAEKGSILLLDDKTEHLCIRNMVGYADPRVLAMQLALTEGYSGGAFETGMPLRVDDVPASEWRYTGDIPEMLALQSAIVAPMGYHGEIIGVIALDNATHTFAFDQADLDLLAVFANQASIALENAQLHSQMSESLAEKEAMLKEIHHRVKNNLQVISSLLNLQVKSITDPAALEALSESQNRVRSMALVHEKLYQSAGLARIDFKEYAQSLVTSLFHAFGSHSEHITFQVNAAAVEVDIETAIPCGLIVNELVSNSLKYAFPNGRIGKIELELCHAADWLRLCVRDDGIGLPLDLDFRQTESLGLKLVSMLASQLGGALTVDTTHGTEFTIAFTLGDSSSNHR